MDLETIERLVRLLESSDIDQLEVEEEGFRVKLKKQGQLPVVTQVAPPSAASTSPAPLSGQDSVAGAREPSQPDDTITIEAPMVGTFYRAPAPDAAPYVEVGDMLTDDTIVCIVEAMKVMNEVKAGVRGKIVDILVENAQPVEFGQPMFLVKPARV